MLRSNRSLTTVTAVGLLLAAASSVAACSSQSDSTSSSQDDLSADKAGGVTLAQVQAAIKAKGASWVAGNTPIAALPRSTRKAMLGVPLDKLPADRVIVGTDDPKVVAEAAASTGAGIHPDIPQTHDWRNIHGVNFVSPIADQGRCGSCVAFATTGTLETTLNIAANDATTPWELSPQYLFSCGGGACDEGWEVPDAVAFLKSTGEVDDACMPYGSGPLGTDVSCSKACSDHAKRAIKITGSSTPTSGGSNTTAIKNALVKGPLIATMTVYDDFGYYTSGVYKHVTGDVDGGHAVSIIGWSNKDQAWICRNQWDTSWGENGFFEIAWSDTDSGVGQETWLLTVAKPGAYVDLANVHDYAVLTGTEALDVDMATGVTAASWTLSQGGKSVATGTSADGKTVAIDTTKVSDGVYTLQASAKSGATAITSEPRTVYILNGKETGAITFTSDIKAGQTVSGESTFNVNVKTSPVPLTEVSWVVTDSTGKAVLTHSTQDPGATMQIFWGTTRFPNGKYTVTITGHVGATVTLPTASIAVVVKN